jgi:hypothetical protein
MILSLRRSWGERTSGQRAEFGHLHYAEDSPSLPRRQVYPQTDLVLGIARSGAHSGRGRCHSTDGGRSAVAPRRRRADRAADVSRPPGQIDHRLAPWGQIGQRHPEPGRIDHPLRRGQDGDRSADSPRRETGGRAATVLPATGQIGHRHRERARIGHRHRERARIGHRLSPEQDGGRSAVTTRRRQGGRAATVSRPPGQIDHRQRVAADLSTVDRSRTRRRHGSMMWTAASSADAAPPSMPVSSAISSFSSSSKMPSSGARRRPARWSPTWSAA